MTRPPLSRHHLLQACLSLKTAGSCRRLYRLEKQKRVHFGARQAQTREAKPHSILKQARPGHGQKCVAILSQASQHVSEAEVNSTQTRLPHEGNGLREALGLGKQKEGLTEMAAAGMEVLSG